MIALKLEPDRSPHLVGIDGIGISDELHLMQAHVGGYLEAVHLKDGGIMLVDEDYALTLKKKPLNHIATALYGQPIFGNALIVGQKDDMLTDVPSKYFALLAFDMV